MPAGSEAKEVLSKVVKSPEGGEAAGMGMGRRWSQCIVFVVKEKKKAKQNRGKNRG
jgi:hypothetical protein